MKITTRQRVLAYAIPVDLVIVATGVGLVVPAMQPLALIGLYVAAVGLSAWKSGWGGSLAAMVLSAVLLIVLFSRSVHGTEVGWFVAASFIVSIPLAKWGARRRPRKLHVEPPAATPPAAPPIATRRSVEETAAAGLFGEGSAVVIDARARAERERIEAERSVKEKRKIDEDFARARERIEQEQSERYERRRAELQSALDREKGALQAKFDAERLELEAQRAELQKQLDEERRRPAVIEKHVDEEAITQRLEHLRAELQQQFERDLQTRLKAELAAQRQALARDSEREIEKIRSAADDRVATFRAELERVLSQQAAASPSSSPPRTRQPQPVRKPGFFSGVFSRKTPVGESTATRRAAVAAVAESSATRRANAAQAAERSPRVLFLESRRAIADTAAPRLKQLGIEIVIVERLVDAVDELSRFRPDVLFIDSELTDFEKAYRTVSDQAKSLPLVLTARNASNIPRFSRAGIAVRPYDIDDVVEIARTAVRNPEALLAKQEKSRPEVPEAGVRPAQDVVPESRERYDIVCYNCRVVFDATEADWCSCLTRERTVVCTNCLTCFCKAVPSYKEIFWMDAPPRLFERQETEMRRKSLGVTANLPLGEVKRPLVMLVDDDPEVQAVLQRVCANLGYGSISAADGLEGLELARHYRPNLILAEAFLPKLDGREMCRLLKEEGFAATRMVVMTGLYADTQHKREAIKRFRIDDYLTKPVSITDLINLLQRYLEGVLDLPVQENLHLLHRKDLDHSLGEEGIRTTYEVACASCGDMFDAAKAEWCTCAGGDNTLVCEHCRKCFCQSPEYRERFWAEAPAVLFERKMIGALRGGVPAADSPPSGVRRPLVMLLEDDEAIQLIVRTVVTALGYRFLASANAQETMALAREHEPDLLLLDAWTARVDGREMARRIKEELAPFHSRAIVMTGRYADQAYRQEALSRFNIDDCIAKPLDAADLLTIVKKYMPQEVRAIPPGSD